MTSEPKHTPPQIPPHPHAKTSWDIFVWANVVFILYGSLFPFDFRDNPLPLWHFLAEWPPSTNTADAVDNFLLFVPLGAGIYARYRSPEARAAASALAILLLGLGVQLLQLYVPGRTSSLADVFWNGWGLLAGMSIFRSVGQFLEKLMTSPAGQRDRFAGVLLLLWLCYESFPFLPSLDIGLLREHVKSAVVAPPFELHRLVEHCVAALLGGMALIRWRPLRSDAISLTLAALLVVSLEILVPYGALRRETLLGMCLGLALSLPVSRWRVAQSPEALLALAFGMYLLTLFSAPFSARSGFTFTPFSQLLWHSVTWEIPPAAYEALALGSGLWASLRVKTLESRPLLGLGLALFLVLFLELVRVIGLGQQGDTTALCMVLILYPFARASGVPPLEPSARPLKQAIAATKPSIRGASAAHVLHVIAVLGFTGWVAWQGHLLQVDQRWLVFWCSCLLGLLAAPRVASTGLLVFLLMAYGTTSDGNQYEVALKLRLNDGITVLSLWAWLLAPKAIPSSATPLWQSRLAWAAVGLFSWLLISALNAVAQGTPWAYFRRLDPSTYAQAIVFFYISAQLLQNKAALRQLAWVACLAITGRALLLGPQGVHLESYVATLLVIGLPLAGLGCVVAERPWERIAFSLMGVVMLVYLYLTENRNAGVALLIVATMFAAQVGWRWSRQRWGAAVMLGAVAACAVLLLMSSGDYLQRFSVLWNDSADHSTAELDRSTMQGRLTLWRMAWEIAIDHPVLGVGPGNYPFWLKIYNPGSGSGGARNSYLQMLAEGGFPGLTLYLALFIGVVWALTHVRLRWAGQWQADAAWMLQLGALAYLATGLFNNRNDLVLAYILAGAGLALHRMVPARTVATAHSANKG